MPRSWPHAHIRPCGHPHFLPRWPALCARGRSCPSGCGSAPYSQRTGKGQSPAIARFRPHDCWLPHEPAQRQHAWRHIRLHDASAKQDALHARQHAQPDAFFWYSTHPPCRRVTPACAPLFHDRDSLVAPVRFLPKDKEGQAADQQEQKAAVPAAPAAAGAQEVRCF